MGQKWTEFKLELAFIKANVRRKFNKDSAPKYSVISVTEGFHRLGLLALSLARGDSDLFLTTLHKLDDNLLSNGSKTRKINPVKQ